LTAGTLPFRFEATLVDNAGLAVDGVGPVRCSIWPAIGSAVGEAGRPHSHSGEAALEFAEELRLPNRSLVLGPEAGLLEGRYRILAATPMEIVPHVVLELLVTRGSA
jgi:hypothetical protein